MRLWQIVLALPALILFWFALRGMHADYQVAKRTQQRFAERSFGKIPARRA
jgi:hypothetical protein